MPSDNSYEDLFSGDFNDTKTWDLICNGNTVGCFQIESRLGRQICRRAQPRNIRELSDIISLMRPGCLEAKLEDGKSITDHYIARKHSREPVSYVDDSLEPILRSTQGLLVYQEQMMDIVRELAGFDYSKADDLRKAAGKKKVALMQSLRKDFLDGCAAAGKVSQDQAETIFSWIEKSQRYSFNQSHSVSYAYLSYATAYFKANNPINFYRSYLSHAEDKTKPQQEIDILIKDADKANIIVKTPDIRHKNIDFEIYNNRIYFGISKIKSIGHDKAQELVDNFEKDYDSWFDLLFDYLVFQKKAATKILISVGAFDYIGEPRKKMLFQHDKCCQLKEKEIAYLKEVKEACNSDPIKALQSLVDQNYGKGTNIHNKRRWQTVKGILSSLKSPPFQLTDTVKELANWEESYLGRSITCSKFDEISGNGDEQKCFEFNQLSGSNIKVIAQIKRVHEIKDKKENEMAFCSLEDNTDEIENVVIFSKQWEKYKDLIKNFEILRIMGRKQEDSFILSHAEEIR